MKWHTLQTAFKFALSTLIPSSGTSDHISLLQDNCRIMSKVIADKKHEMKAHVGQWSWDSIRTNASAEVEIEWMIAEKLRLRAINKGQSFEQSPQTETSTGVLVLILLMEAEKTKFEFHCEVAQLQSAPAHTSGTALLKCLLENPDEMKAVADDISALAADEIINFQSREQDPHTEKTLKMMKDIRFIKSYIAQ